ncbi:MAG: trypsin-like peptidase domain-containing protein [Armatimonadetes bacterium]|nr:trypsin-like peptidase domain-containing protein [Armatimonadota bacterium]
MHALIALIGVAGASQQVSPEELYENASPSVLTLTVDRPGGTVSIGTAFLAFRPNVAVTAWHVVKGARRVTAKFSDGTSVTVQGLIDKDPAKDIALISLETGSRKPLPLAGLDPKVGSRAFVIGSPKGMEFSISDGLISQTPIVGTNRLYQFTCPVSPGNSGGPLFNTAGQVLGIVSWQWRDAQNLNFAVPTKELGGLDNAHASVPFSATVAVPSGPLLKSVDDKALTDLFHTLELGVKTKDDGTGKTAFVYDAEGTKITLFQYAKDAPSGPTVNLSLGAGYSGAADLDLEKLNAFNREHRFARCYRDEAGTVFVEDDVDLEPGIGTARLVRFIETFGQTVSEFERSVFGGKTVRTTQTAPQPGTGHDALCVQIGDGELEKVLDSVKVKWTKVEDGSGASSYEFLHSGVKVRLHQFSDRGQTGPATSLALTVGVAMDRSVPLTKINGLNASARFFKVFTDSEGDPFLVADLDLAGGVAPTAVQEFVRSYLDTVPWFLKKLSDKD